MVSKSKLAARVLGLAGLMPGSVEVGLVCESVVMSLGSGSPWEDLNPGSTGANQEPRTTGLGSVSGSVAAGPILGKAKRLVLQKPTWEFGSGAGGAAGGCHGARVSLNPESIGAGLESRLEEISLMLE